MDNSSPLSPESVTLVDANVFISVGNPGTSKHHRFRRTVRRANVPLLVPARVEEEIEQGGVTPALERAQDEGWAKVVAAPTVSHSKATTAQDIVRRAMPRNRQKKMNTMSKKPIQCSLDLLWNTCSIPNGQTT